MQFDDPTRRQDHDGEDGYMLLAVVVLVFVVLLMLSIAAPKMAMELKHDQEMETKHRADQYVRAIRLYYRKTQSYPPSIDVLTQQTNGQRYLRQKYLDPLTGKDDWRLIIVGQNKTKVKGLFGQDLPGLGGGLGSAAGMQSSTDGSTGSSPSSAFGTSPTGGSSAFGSGSSSSFGSGSSSFGSGSSTPGQTGGLGSTGSTGSSGTTGSSGSSSGIGEQNATDYTGSGGPIMGVGVPKQGLAMLTVNEKTNYQDWEFLYDPRSEPTGAAGMGGGGTGIGSGTGAAPGAPTNSSPFGSPSNSTGTSPTSPSTPANPTSPSTTTNPTSQ